jgi:transglutaminase-like putative cysteine protease
MMQLSLYLQPSKWIDFEHPVVAAKAKELAAGCVAEEDIARNCFVFVRDAIQHSLDFKRNPITCRASDVLTHGTGYCFAKSHLLAALLRANGIPAGLCYQRLVLDPARGARCCLHGLNAVFLKQYGWYRIDPRGNKPGVEADFTPPTKRLAFAIQYPGEADLPEIWPAPLAIIVEALTQNDTVEQVFERLPDIEVCRLK